MNISKNEQRALHVLALGGRILHERENGPKITSVTCVTREGMILSWLHPGTWTTLSEDSRRLNSWGSCPEPR
jgi:uncharacterized protein YjhX (UPF0386 family)